jgi:predicted RNase H-like HicB family nuclease
MYEQIPVEVLEQHEGKWIVWDQDEKRVVGSGDTLDQAEQQAETAKTKHLLRVHHVLHRDTEIAGML